ncbi:hypothetical protein D0812_22215 [Vibrio owensii]|uniref:Uncharacterized protein n=1 Tax=Vibrio owensii TaxID=696485 RepID=A0AAP9GG84_9VIBR|nr:hypothetical protein [Vibrio owensii]AYO17107.1 hypothetical protein D0812_22215 [Vibrio owensii]QGH49252.1 hypothetical protein APZ19_19225 [Vibrio owensii]
MDSTKKVIGSLLILFSTHTVASDSVADWNEEKNSAITIRDQMHENYQKEGYTDIRRKAFTALIGSAVSGQQRLYFEIEANNSTIDFSKPEKERMIDFMTSVTGENYCDPSTFAENSTSNDSLSKGPRSSTWKVNGTNVRMNEWCTRSTIKIPMGDKGKYYWYLSATPVTDRGDNYIINTFKSAKKSVAIEASTGDKYNVSAKGFTKVWNNFGGDAL